MVKNDDVDSGRRTISFLEKVSLDAKVAHPGVGSLNSRLSRSFENFSGTLLLHCFYCQGVYSYVLWVENHIFQKMSSEVEKIGPFYIVFGTSGIFLKFRFLENSGNIVTVYQEKCRLYKFSDHEKCFQQIWWFFMYTATPCRRAKFIQDSRWQKISDEIKWWIFLGKGGWMCSFKCSKLYNVYLWN